MAGGKILKRFGSNPVIFTKDFGETWLQADGSPATLPLTYATTTPKLAPYDHLTRGETSEWFTRDLGFGPSGARWIILPVGKQQEMRFFYWGLSGWESTSLTTNLDRGDPVGCGATRDYLVCAFAEIKKPGSLLVRVSNDDGRTWGAPFAVDNVGRAPNGSAQGINWVSFVQPAEECVDNAARFFYGYYKQRDGINARNYENNIRWVRFHVGPRPNESGDGHVE